MHKQRENFLTVRKSVPTDRAVVVGCDSEFAVARNIHAPGYAGHAMLPYFLAVFAVAPDAIIPAKHKAVTTGRDRNRSRMFVLLEFKRLAVEFRIALVVPVDDLKAPDVGSDKPPYWL